MSGVRVRKRIFTQSFCFCSLTGMTAPPKFARVVCTGSVRKRTAVGLLLFAAPVLASNSRLARSTTAQRVPGRKTQKRPVMLRPSPFDDGDGNAQLRLDR